MKFKNTWKIFLQLPFPKKYTSRYQYSLTLIKTIKTSNSNHFCEMKQRVPALAADKEVSVHIVADMVAALQAVHNMLEPDLLGNL